MNNGHQKIILKLSVNDSNGNFYVGKFSPFVCSLSTSISPFIGKYEPFNQFKDNKSLASNRSRGFSLIELIVTMVVVAIVAAIVIPNIRVVIKDSRISTQINGLKADLNFARSEAIKRRTDVIICQSSNGTSCVGAVGDWKDGRLIFVDRGKDGSLTVNDDTILRYREAVGGADRILKVTGNDPLIFTENGGTKTPPGNLTTTFTICDEQGATKGKSLVISPTGLATTIPAASCT